MQHAVNTFSSELFLEKEAFCLRDWPLSCLYLLSCKSIPNHSFVLIYLHTVDWAVNTQALFHHYITFTQSHTLPSRELPSITKLLSSSTGADEIKGKGCSAAFVLFCVFTFSLETFEIVPCYAQIQVDKWNFVSSRWTLKLCWHQLLRSCLTGSSFTTSWIVTPKHICTGV